MSLLQSHCACGDPVEVGHTKCAVCLLLTAKPDQRPRLIRRRVGRIPTTFTREEMIDAMQFTQKHFGNEILKARYAAIIELLRRTKG